MRGLHSLVNGQEIQEMAQMVVQMVVREVVQEVVLDSVQEATVVQEVQEVVQEVIQERVQAEDQVEVPRGASCPSRATRGRRPLGVQADQAVLTDPTIHLTEVIMEVMEMLQP